MSQEDSAVKPRPWIWIALCAVVLLLCAAYFATRDRAPTIKAPRAGVSFSTNFATQLAEEDWYIGDHSFESGFNRTGWVADQVTVSQDTLHLAIDRRPTEFQPHSGAEVHRKGFFHYGRYEVVMKPAKGSGLISSFFTHTFKMFGDPHDEIDIEFLGKDTERLHINYFTGGKAHSSIYIDLGFDAAEETHLYAFEWFADHINWYVDDRLVHTAFTRDHPIPSAPGRLIMNLWTGSETRHN